MITYSNKYSHGYFHIKYKITDNDCSRDTTFCISVVSITLVLFSLPFNTKIFKLWVSFCRIFFVIYCVNQRKLLQNQQQVSTKTDIFVNFQSQWKVSAETITNLYKKTDIFASFSGFTQGTENNVNRTYSWALSCFN
jgi:hypothetical protein